LYTTGLLLWVRFWKCLVGGVLYVAHEMRLSEVVLDDSEDSLEDVLSVVRGEGGAFHVRDSLFVGVLRSGLESDLAFMSYIYLVAHKNPRHLPNALGVTDVKSGQQLVIDSLYDIEGALITDGKHKNISINANGVLQTKEGMLILAVGVDDAQVIMQAIDHWLPLVHILEGGHIVGLETTKGATDRESALSNSTRAQNSDALAQMKRLSLVVGRGSRR